MNIQTIIKTTKSDLKRWVAQDILDSSEGYESIISRINDIMYGGCISGTVSSLIYYSDTEAFFDKFEEEIIDIVNEYEQQTSQKYQVKDWYNYKNNLAWFAYEHLTSEIQGELCQ